MPHKETSLCFALHCKDRVYYLIAETEQAYDVWIANLLACIDCTKTGVFRVQPSTVPVVRASTAPAPADAAGYMAMARREGSKVHAHISIPSTIIGLCFTARGAVLRAH